MPVRAPVAQWIERSRPKAGVGGSNPSGGARSKLSAASPGAHGAWGGYGACDGCGYGACDGCGSAAERGSSVSAIVAEYLRSLSGETSTFARLEAQQHAIQQEITRFRAGDRLGRDEVHDREVR